MALPLPNLDDRTYADLVEEARALIPSLYPEWTNHNPTDPGITLIELFAWLTEMLIYRANRVPDQHMITFLKLLNGPDWKPGTALAENIRESVVTLRRRYRAVTCEDYEALAKEASPAVAKVKCVPRRYLGAGTEADRTVSRPGHVSIIVVPRLSFDNVSLFDGAYTDHTAEASTEGATPFLLNSAPEHFLYVGLRETFTGIQFRLNVKGVNYGLKFDYFDGLAWVQLTETVHNLTDYTSGWAYDGLVTFVTPSNWAQTAINGATQYWIRISTTTTPRRVVKASRIIPQFLQPSTELIQIVKNDLEPRRLLTTRYHVVGPIYAPVSAEILIASRADVPPEDLRKEVATVLVRFLDSLTGGPDGNGWPFGRDIYTSELYELLEGLSGLDYVPDIALSSRCPQDATRCVAATELWHEDGDLVGLGLAPHHLPQAQIDPSRIVISAGFVPVHVRIKVNPAGSVEPLAVYRAVKSAVKRFFHPLHGGPDGTTTREITLASIRTLVRGLPEVDDVTDISLQSESARLLRDELGNVTGVRIETGKLTDVQVTVQLG